MKDERGFTIVELLIVIVVIAILAAIVIVAYNGIQQRAHTATARSNAEGVQKVVEAYAADDSAGSGKYPSLSDLTGWTGGVTRIPNGVTVDSATLSSTHGGDGKVIQYVPDASSDATGGCIGYWDSSNNQAVYVYAGAAKTGTNAAAPTCSDS